LRDNYAALFGLYKNVPASNGGWQRMKYVYNAGAFDNVNISASFLSIGLMAFIRGKWIYFAPIILWAMILSGGVAGYFTVAAGLVFYLSRDKKWLPGLFIASLALATVGVLVLPYVHDVFATGARVEVWAWALRQLDISEWFFGKGVGWWAVNSPRFIINGAKVRFVQLHNEYLEVLYSVGLVGIVAMLCVARKAMAGAKYSHPCFIALFGAVAANSFVHFTFHIAATACIGIIAVAVLAGGCYVNRLERA
jgi:hypothetical protein